MGIIKAYLSSKRVSTGDRFLAVGWGLGVINNAGAGDTSHPARFFIRLAEPCGEGHT